MSLLCKEEKGRKRVGGSCRVQLGSNRIKWPIQSNKKIQTMTCDNVVKLCCWPRVLSLWSRQSDFQIGISINKEVNKTTCLAS